MKCVTLVVIIILAYLAYLIYEYNEDKFETIHQNPIAERFFDDNVKVYVINLPQHQNRMSFMKEQFDEQKIEFTRVIAPDINAVDKKFIDEWPTMKGDKYKGTKGLYLSNIKAMEMGLKQNKPWVLIFEDDVQITKNFKEKIYNIINDNKSIEVFNLDKILFRNDLTAKLTMALFKTLGHTGGILYRKDILAGLVNELNYKSSRHIKKFPKPAIYDQYFWWLLKRMGITFKVVPMNKKDIYASTIGTSHHRGRIPFTSYI